jgi:predicted Holliday junction resolvase-like endonuclease
VIVPEFFVYLVTAVFKNLYIANRDVPCLQQFIIVKRTKINELIQQTGQNTDITNNTERKETFQRFNYLYSYAGQPPRHKAAAFQTYI